MECVYGQDARVIRHETNNRAEQIPLAIEAEVTRRGQAAKVKPSGLKPPITKPKPPIVNPKPEDKPEPWHPNSPFLPP